MKVNFIYTNGRERMMGKNYAIALSKLGHGSYLTRDMRAARVEVTEPADAPDEEDVMKALRAEYQAAFGKRAFPGWGEATLRQKIAEAPQ